MNKASLTELKSLSNPPRNVQQVCAALVVLLGDVNVSSETNGGDKFAIQVWRSVKTVLGEYSLLNRLKVFDSKDVSPEQARVAKECIQDLTVEQVKNVSFAASILFSWVDEAIKASR